MAQNLNDPQQYQQQQGNPQPQGQEPPKQKGTGFTNLSRVIGANQNNKLGQAVGGGVQKLATNASTGLQQTQNQFNQQTQGAQQQIGKDVEASQKALQQIAQNYGSGEGGDQQQSQNQQENPLNADTMQSFSRLGRGQYQGPQQLNVGGQLQSNINEAQSLGQLAGSQNREALLQRFVGGPQYTSGQQKLDSLLLGQTAAPQLAQASRSGAQLGQKLNQAEQQAQLQAQQGQQQLLQGKQQALAGTQSQAGQLDQALAQRQQDQIAKQQGLYAQMQQGLSSDNPAGQEGTNALLDLYRSKGGSDNTQFLNKQDFLSSLSGLNQDAITKSAVANQSDMARAQALQNISGALGSQYNARLDPSQLGAAAQNKYLGLDVNADAIKQAQSARQAQYNQYVANPTQSVDFSNRALQLLNRAGTTGMFNTIAGGSTPEDRKLASDIKTQLGGAESLGKHGEVDIERARTLYSQQAAAQQAAIDQLRKQYNYYGLDGRGNGDLK